MVRGMMDGGGGGGVGLDTVETCLGLGACLGRVVASWVGRGSAPAWYKQLLQAVGETARQEYHDQLAEVGAAQGQPHKSRRVDRESCSSSRDSPERAGDGASEEAATSPHRADVEEDAGPFDNGEEF